VIARQHGSIPSFTVYPAIDVLDGRVVRLEQGERGRVTVEGGDPLEGASRFRDEGAAWLHLVDLGGAFSSTPSLELLADVAAIGVPVQVGGGYRDLPAIQAALDAGAARVLVGTAALDPVFLRSAADRFGARLTVAIDVRDGFVAVEGWTRASSVPADVLAASCREAGVQRLVVTSTRRDGTLSGPDLELLELVLEASQLPVIAAGGVASLDDLRAVRGLGCEGAVVGSALWRGRFTLAEAVSLER
jgi:phosphoribosylformimino-5-aminoimidazole carboxamide ribotide isomerase